MLPPMLRITAEKRTLCDGLRRRDVLRVGTASLLGPGRPAGNYCRHGRRGGYGLEVL